MNGGVPSRTRRRDVSLFAVRDDGLGLLAREGSGGSVPQSVAEHDGLVYVLNTGDDANVTGLRIENDGLVAIERSTRYSIDQDGALDLEDAAAGTSVEGRPGLRDEDLTPDGRYLYAVDADAQRVFGWAVGEDGSLAPLGSWDGLPATVAGLAAR
jgi:hypothetical protein